MNAGMDWQLIQQWAVYAFVSLAIGSAVAFAEGLNVWAAGEGARINPLTGKAFEENPEALPGGITGDYRTRSLIWDGATRTVSLKGAANEVLAFQLILEGAGVKGITVKAEPLKGPDGATIPAGNVTFFRAFYVHVKQAKDRKRALFPLEAGWYPDPLVPLDTPRLGAPFAIDGSNFGGQKPKGIRNQTIWVDLWVPKKAAKGTYQGKVTAGFDGGSVVLNLQVEVLGFQLPDENHTVVEFMSYGSFADMARPLREEIFRLAHRHRANITNTKPYAGYEPELMPKNGRFDWRGFDEFWGPAISGKLHADGPRAGVPMTHFNLPFDPVVNRPDKGVARKGRGWPIANPTKSGGTEVDFTPGYVKELTRLLQDADRHFALTYPKTTIVVFQDALDEAGFHKDSKELALAQLRSIQGYLKIFRQAGLKRTLYKLDIGSGFARCRHDLDGDGKVEGPKEVVDAMGDSVGLWNINGLSIDLDALQPVLRRGAQVWFYNGFEPRVGPTVIGTEALGPRTWPWVVWNSDVHGMCHWHFLWGTNLKPWVTGGIGPRQRDNKHPGNAMFIYPGRDVGLPERAFASVRLKAIRRGMQDYEYLWLLAKADGRKDRAKYFSTRVVRNSLGQRVDVKDFGDDVTGEVSRSPVRGDQRHWSHHPEAFEKVRHRIGEILGRGRKG